MALAAGGRDSVEVRDMGMEMLHKHLGFAGRAIDREMR